MSSKSELFNKIVEEIYHYSSDGNFSKVRDLLNEHRTFLLDFNPMYLVKTDIESYLNENDLLKAYLKVEEYKNEPLISVEVELYLNEMKDKISAKLDASDIRVKTPKSIKELGEMFDGNAGDKKDAYLYFRENFKETPEYLDLVQEIFLKDAKDDMKRLILIILSTKKVDKDFKVKINNQTFVLNPIKIVDLNKSEDVLAFRKEIDDNAKNITVMNFMHQLFAVFLFNLYPSDFKLESWPHLYDYLYIYVMALLEPTYNEMTELSRRKLDKKTYEYIVSLTNQAVDV
jgi:hypothetical protein